MSSRNLNHTDLGMTTEAYDFLINSPEIERKLKLLSRGNDPQKIRKLIACLGDDKVLYAAFKATGKIPAACLITRGNLGRNNWYWNQKSIRWGWRLVIHSDGSPLTRLSKKSGGAGKPKSNRFSCGIWAAILI